MVVPDQNTSRKGCILIFTTILATIVNMKTRHLLRSLALLFSWLLFVSAHGAFVMTYLYWEVEWLDLPMHLFGGVLFVASWQHLRSLGVFPGVFARYGALSGLLVAIIGWEIFKYGIGSTVLEGYVLDTIVDIVLGLIGGLIALWVIASRRIGV